MFRIFENVLMNFIILKRVFIFSLGIYSWYEIWSNFKGREREGERERIEFGFRMIYIIVLILFCLGFL